MTYDPDPVVLVVEAIAEAEGVEPLELEYTLHDHVYTDSIDRLTGGEYTDWELTFEVPGHEVRIRAGDGVYVDGQRRRAFRDGAGADGD